MQLSEHHVDVGIRSRVTLHLKDVPVGGFVQSPFVWDDLLHEPMPHADRAPPCYCVPSAEVVAGSERVENAVLVSVDQDGVVQVEHRLGIVQRVMGGAIRAERQFIGDRVQDWPRPIARAVRSVTRGAMAVPDRFRSRARKARQMLATKEGRARVGRGLVDPHSLSGEEKAITVFLLLLSVLGILLVAHVSFTLIAPAHATPWRAGVLLYLLAFVHSLGAPVLWEPVLLAAAFATTPLTAVLVGTSGKVTAAFLAAFLGDAVNDKLEKRAARSPRWARALEVCERFAQRFGAWAIALFIATPGLPDAFVIYAFALLRMPVWKYLLGVAGGSLALNVAIVYGLGRLIGLG